MIDTYSIVVFGLFGVLIGSFLNVVIYRFPVMLEARWKLESLDNLGMEKSDQLIPVFNLSEPRSTCPKCGHKIRWYENIPIISYLMLGAKCSNCRSPISMRYPLIEAFTGILFAWCGYKFGITAQALAWCLFSCAMIVLAMIDLDTMLLPDDITLPLVWLAFIVAMFGFGTVNLKDSVLGAAIGYLILWTVFWVFKIATGKEGMGYGDFKLLAALGAWFGWQSLVSILLMASLIGAIIGIAMKYRNSLNEGGQIPFGPFLSGSGLVAMIFGPTAFLSFIGLS